MAEDYVTVIGANTYRMLSQIVAEEEDPSSARMADGRTQTHGSPALAMRRDPDRL